MSRSVTGGWRSEWKWFVVAAALIAPACSGNTNPGFGDTAGQDASTADGSVGDGGDSSSVSDGTSHLDIAMLDAGIDASDAGGSNDVHAGIDVPDATDIADGGSDMGADETTEQDAATDAAISSDADAEDGVRRGRDDELRRGCMPTHRCRVRERHDGGVRARSADPRGVRRHRQ